MKPLAFGLIAFPFLLGMLAIYAVMIRPVVMMGIRRQFQALHDELRVRVLEGKVPQNERAFRELDRRLRFGASVDYPIGISALIVASQRPIESAAAEDTLEHCGPAIRDIYDRANQLSLVGIVGNSPAWWILIPLVVVLVPVSLKARQIWQRMSHGPDLEMCNA